MRCSPPPPSTASPTTPGHRDDRGEIPSTPTQKGDKAGQQINRETVIVDTECSDSESGKGGTHRRRPVVYMGRLLTAGRRRSQGTATATSPTPTLGGPNWFARRSSSCGWEAAGWGLPLAEKLRGGDGRGARTTCSAGEQRFCLDDGSNSPCDGHGLGSPREGPSLRSNEPRVVASQQRERCCQ